MAKPGPVRQSKALVEKGLRDGGPEMRARLLARMRQRAERAIDRLGELVNARGRRGSQQVSLSAAKTLLALLEKAERQVEDDRLAAVEAALRAEGKLPPLPDTDTPAQPAPGAD